MNEYAFFEKLFEEIKKNKSTSVLDGLSIDQKKAFRNYYDKKVEEEKQKLYEKYKSLSDEGKKEVLEGISQEKSKILFQKYLEELFYLLAHQSEEDRAPYVNLFSEKEYEAFLTYLDNVEIDDDGERGDGAFVHVLKHTLTRRIPKLESVIGTRYTCEVIEEIMPETPRERYYLVNKYNKLIEIIDKNTLEDRPVVDRGRGHH